jgi:hypothetical protein
MTRRSSKTSQPQPLPLFTEGEPRRLFTPQPQLLSLILNLNPSSSCNADKAYILAIRCVRKDSIRSLDKFEYILSLGTMVEAPVGGEALSVTLISLEHSIVVENPMIGDPCHCGRFIVEGVIGLSYCGRGRSLF